MAAPPAARRCSSRLAASAPASEARSQPAGRTARGETVAASTHSPVVEAAHAAQRAIHVVEGAVLLHEDHDVLHVGQGAAVDLRRASRASRRGSLPGFSEVRRGCLGMRPCRRGSRWHGDGRGRRKQVCAYRHHQSASRKHSEGSRFIVQFNTPILRARVAVPK